MRVNPRYLILAAVVAGIAAALYFFPLSRWALALVEYIRDAGATGVAVYAVAYVIAAVLFLPGSILTLGAGFAYGPLWGTVLVSPVSVVASTVTFLLGRFLARSWIQRKVESQPRFAAVDAAIGENGFKIVFLLRLSPIFPYNLLNYALGITRVRLLDYILASWLGMLPGTFLYVYLGSLVTSASRLLSEQAPQAESAWTQVLYWGGLVATVLVVVIVTRTARRALARALEDPAVELRDRPDGVQP